MTGTAWEHRRETREALHTIVSDPHLGIGTLSNAQTLSNLLKDLLPDAPRETSVLVAAVIIGLAMIGSIVALATHTGTITRTTVGPLSQVIGPAVTSGKNVAGLSTHGVTDAQSCHTHAQNIGLVGYQFGAAADYKAGLAELNLLTGFDAATAGHSCPPASGRTSGWSPWHSNDNANLGSRSGQILECYPYRRDTKVLIYLWTLPTQRVILIANDQAAGATYTSLGHWWSRLTYG